MRSILAFSNLLSLCQVLLNVLVGILNLEWLKSKRQVYMATSIMSIEHSWPIALMSGLQFV